MNDSAHSRKDFDAILDDVENILEHDASEFISNFKQFEGNGGIHTNVDGADL